MASGRATRLGTRVLNSKFELHDVQDVEALATAIVLRYHPGLGFHDREDLTAFLIEEAWIASTRNRHNESFFKYVTIVMRNRSYDWLRSRRGPTRWVFKTHVHERKLPTFVEWTPELDETLSDGAGDPAERGDYALAEVLGL